MPKNVDVDVTPTHRPIEYVHAAIVAIVAGVVALFLLAVLISFKFTGPKDFATGMGNAVLIFLIVVFVLIAIGAVIAGRMGKHKHTLLTQEEESGALGNRMQKAKIALVETHGERINTGVAVAVQHGLPFELTPAGGLKITPLYPMLHSIGDGAPVTQNLALGQGKTLHVPTFAESMEAGDIGPNQKEMLFCHELTPSEQTPQLIELNPVRGEIGALHTQFIAGGSQSGKTTYMSGIVGQAAAMHTLFYIIDPHKMHPEKSIASKIQAFSSYFILPPAGTHEEIAKLLAHATMTRDALIQGHETHYQGYHIMVVVDEVPALMTYQKSQDKQIKNLYISLALFMQSIGTQTAKFGMTGLYGSQFVTKEELGAIEIREACMSQLLLRLHPNQAQAMRILGKLAMHEIPTLDKGHGFLMLSNSFEPSRVASGNVTQEDLTRLASQLPPSPLTGDRQDIQGQEQEQKPGQGQEVTGELTEVKYLAPYLDGELRKVYDACKRIEQAGERISARNVSRMSGVQKDKANAFIHQLASKGLIVRRSTD